MRGNQERKGPRRQHRQAVTFPWADIWLVEKLLTPVKRARTGNALKFVQRFTGGWSARLASCPLERPTIYLPVAFCCRCPFFHDANSAGQRLVDALKSLDGGDNPAQKAYNESGRTERRATTKNFFHSFHPGHPIQIPLLSRVSNYYQ